MSYLIYKWLLTTAALYLTSLIIPGISIEGVLSAFLAAAILGLINALIKPLLIFLTLPITILTLGLSILVINALLLWLAGSIGINGFAVDGFLSAFLGSIVMSFFGMILNRLLSA
jgi:putative membrane protein